jgi:manganese/iron transport system substrate-binding protein
MVDLRKTASSISSMSVVLLISLSGCASSNQTSEQTATAESSEQLPLVVATSSVICDLTRQIAKETIALKCLIAAGQDPHVYQAKPDDRKAIDSAKLVLYAGYNFDQTLVKLIDASSNPAEKIAVHERAVPQPLVGEEHHHEHGEEHHHEGEKAQEKEIEEREPDPHIWHDAQNGVAMVKVIADALTKLEPKNAEAYETNAQKIVTELNSIDRWIEKEIATIPLDQRKLVTTHDALGYFANAYGLEVEGALQGLSTEEAPTAARVSELVTEIEATGVPTIFAETTTNPKLINTVAKEAGVKIAEQKLYADGLGETGSSGESYQKMLIVNTESIVEGLGGKYTPFGKN